MNSFQNSGFENSDFQGEKKEENGIIIGNRPNREKAINQDDICNLIIALETATSIDELSNLI